ncbi:MAG: hypothetical protein ACK5MH_00405 [Bacteroidales bacterium]
MRAQKKFKVIFTAEQFREKGFDGQIAIYMRNNRNSAIYELENGKGVVEFLKTK